MNETFKGVLSVAIVCGSAAYLTTRVMSQSGDSGHALNHREAGMSKYQSLKAMTEDALREQQQKLVALGTQIQTLEEQLALAKAEQATARESVASMEKVIRSFGFDTRTAQTDLRSVDSAKANEASVAKPLRASVPEKPAYSNAASSSSENLEGIVAQLNAQLKKPVARVEASNGETSVALSGSYLLLTDKNRLRIGRKQLAQMFPLLQHLRSWRVGEVVLKATPDVPSSHVAALSDYIKKQFGWQARIEVNDRADMAPIQINVSGR